MVNHFKFDCWIDFTFIVGNKIMNVLDILKNKNMSLVINNDNNHLILYSEKNNSYLDLGDAYNYDNLYDEFIEVVLYDRCESYKDLGGFHGKLTRLAKEYHENDFSYKDGSISTTNGNTTIVATGEMKLETNERLKESEKFLGE